MVLSQETRAAERERIAQMVLDLIKLRGAPVTYSNALLESGLSRARFEQIFANEDELFDAVAQLWLAPKMAAMEEVLASDLPPKRKMYEFFRCRFVISRERWRTDPEYFAIICEMAAANFEKVRSYVDLADHYLCELIVQAQAEGYFAGLSIDATLSLINQMSYCYTMPDTLVELGDKLSEEKLARIVDALFTGLSGQAGEDASGVKELSVAS